MLNKLLKLGSVIGLPESVTADGHSLLNSQLITTLHPQLGIESQCSTPWHHVGLAERYSRAIGSILEAFNETVKRNWDNLVPYFCFASNNYQTLYVGRGTIYTRVWSAAFSASIRNVKERLG